MPGCLNWEMDTDRYRVTSAAKCVWGTFPQTKPQTGLAVFRINRASNTIITKRACFLLDYGRFLKSDAVWAFVWGNRHRKTPCFRLLSPKRANVSPKRKRPFLLAFCHKNDLKIWWEIVDSNHRPLACQASALTN